LNEHLPAEIRILPSAMARLGGSENWESPTDKVTGSPARSTVMRIVTSPSRAASKVWAK
jgi:hypothetical protein